MILLLADIFGFRVTGVLQKMAASDVSQAEEEKQGKKKKKKGKQLRI